MIVNQSIETNSKGKAKLDLDLKKGKYIVNVTYSGNENYTGNSTSEKLSIKEATTIEENSVDTSAYPDYSPYFGNYRIVETENELALVETSDGKYYVFAGDGAYTYGGHDSQGYIELGTYVGKY